jgi:7-cyano-7-deazaguanine synthase in queuosine biosynthesis
MQNGKLKRAAVAEAGAPIFAQRSGRLRLPFRIDSLDCTVHGIYHDPPDLPPALWQACIEELTLACLVDMSTASMAREARVATFEPGRLGRRMFRSAAEALRLEVLADHDLPLHLMPVALRGSGRARSVPPANRPDPNRVLLLMGGGKDSLYSYDLLRRAGYEVHCFYLTERRRTWQQLRKVYGALEKQVPHYRAYLDANSRTAIEKRYGEHYLSQFQIGQVIAAALPYALANRCQYLALGLERSSDAHMLHYRGRPVNHQHQKSSSFIRELNRHLAWRFQGAVQVVSPLHGLYDMGIYARFLKSSPALVPFQSSCGGANGRSPHCGRCEKCAFLAALLAGLGGDHKLYRALFPRDPLQDLELFDAWLSPEADRPLTCAGFADEVRLALALVRSRGWTAKVLEERSYATCDSRDLAIYLGSHPNRLIPDAMRRRIAPHLRLPLDEWTRRLA